MVKWNPRDEQKWELLARIRTIRDANAAAKKKSQKNSNRNLQKKDNSWPLTK